MDYKMKKFIVITITNLLALSSYAALKITETNNHAPTNDNLIGYQWSIFNNGQVVTSDLDDIHPKIQKVVSGVGVSWKNYDSSFKRDVVVAVIDSGIDTSHPDIKSRVLPGYNFVAKDPRGVKLVDDDVGHGTHISGIIAAESNNGLGISGLSNRIKLLPLKVYDSHEKGLGAGTQKVAISERVALAVDYAVQQKADVILLSLGWPRALNSEKVQASFEKALDAGVLIVAAAGNDHHDAHIFPCSYTGVICVGALDVEGNLASFSNYGGHVDLLAPGQEILSLWPQVKLSERFGPKGYELKSGTSQAAPLVAGALAILRGLYPQSSAAELRWRLLTNGSGESPVSNFGNLNIEKAVQNSPAVFVGPVFKEIESVSVNPTSGEFSLPVIIESSAGPLPEWKILSGSDVVQFDSVKLIRSKNSVHYFEVQGRLSSLQELSKLSYSIQIGSRSYFNSIRMALSLDAKVTHSFALTKDGLVEKLRLQSVPQMGFEKDHYFWAFESLKNSLRIHLIRPGTNVERRTVELPGVHQPQPGFSFIAGNWLLDHKTSFLIGAIENGQDGKPKNIHYFYLNEKLEVQYHFTLNYEGVVPTFSEPSDISVISKKLSNGISLLTPVFWDNGLIPTKDRDPNPLHFEVNKNENRLFYFEPQTKNNSTELITRCFCSNWIEEQTRRQLNLSITDEIAVTAMLKQNLSDFDTGVTQILLSVGKGITAINYILKISNNEVRLLSAGHSSFDLTHQFAQQGWTIGSNGFDTETVFQGIFSPVAARSVHFNPKRTESFLATSLSLPERGEDIIGVVKSFSSHNGQLSFFETTSSIRAQGVWNGVAFDNTASLYRSSFLPGRLFTQLLTPVMISGAAKSPALIFDGTGLFANLISVYKLNTNGSLESDVQNTFLVPSNCSMRNSGMNQDGDFTLWFLCNEKDSVVFKAIEI